MHFRFYSRFFQIRTMPRRAKSRVISKKPGVTRPYAARHSRQGNRRRLFATKFTMSR